MFDEPDERAQEHAGDPAQQAREKGEELRIHAELFAIFEGVRKFDAAVIPGLDAGLAREIQQHIGRLEKAKTPESPILPPPAAGDAAELLTMPGSHNLAPNHYHLYRRPGEAMILRWLEGEEVATFYERMQAHFDVGLEQCREDERQASEWKQDPKTKAYLTALDAIEIRMADRYLREMIRKHSLFVLSTLTVDEMDILHLSEYMMGVSAGELVGDSAPPSEPTEQDRAWFFKLFSLRGMHEGAERLCFFAYLQKSEETW